MAADPAVPMVDIEPQAIRPASAPPPGAPEGIAPDDFGFATGVTQPAVAPAARGGLDEEFRGASQLMPGLEAF